MRSSAGARQRNVHKNAPNYHASNVLANARLLSTAKVIPAPSNCLLPLAAELGMADPVGADEDGADEVVGTAEEVELSRLDRLVMRTAVVLTGPGGMSSEVEVKASLLLPLLDRERDVRAVGKEMVRVIESTIVGNVSRLSTVLAARGAG